ncbi:MAG: AMP-binding protein [Allomuricauda sp.]
MKQNPSYRSVHADFKLDGIHYNFDELREIAYNFVKEGNPFEISMGDFLLDWVSEKPTLEVFTSGSTGKPKKISLKKEHMLNSAKATGFFFDLKAGDKALLCLPCSGIAGKMMLVRAMAIGMDLRYVEPSSVPLQNNSNFYDFVAMTPLQVGNSLEQLSQIGTLIVGGAPISTSLKQTLEDAPNAIFETYGMTETITHIAAKRLSNPADDNFQILPDISISVDDRDCLIISAPHISDNKVITNDIVEMVNAKSFKWFGRFDTVINSGGVKLIPEKIEEKLSSFIKPRFFVAGIPDDALGQKLVLVVEDVKMSKQELLQQIKGLDKLGKYEVPKEIFSLKTFQETKTGKIHREKTLQRIR